MMEKYVSHRNMLLLFASVMASDACCHSAGSLQSQRKGKGIIVLLYYELIVQYWELYCSNTSFWLNSLLALKKQD